MLCAKNDDAGLVLPQFYALGIISFATIVNSKDIIAKELEILESNNRIKNIVFPFYKLIKGGSGGGSSLYSLYNLDCQNFESHPPFVASG